MEKNISSTDRSLTHAQIESFQQLFLTIAKLRHPQEGCPWDLAQTHQTLLPYLMEEVQEFISAIEENNFLNAKKELGDVLLQILLHAQIAQESHHFNFFDVCDALKEKMIQRHPHVFNRTAPTDATRPHTAQEVAIQWQAQKASERKNNDPATERDDFYKLPPLLAAHKIGQFSQHHGFDWENSQQVFEKVQEEVQELATEIHHSSNLNNRANRAQQEEELGDALFSLVQLARHLNISAEIALMKSNQKFMKRFALLEELALKKNTPILTMNLQEKEDLWMEVKNILKNK